jgi:hypothetical protein
MILLLYAAFTYILTYQNKIGVDDNVFKFLLIIDGLVLIGTLFTLFYKVSIHAIGIMGLAGILIPLNKESDNALLLWITIGVVVLAGIIMSAQTSTKCPHAQTSVDRRAFRFSDRLFWNHSFILNIPYEHLSIPEDIQWSKALPRSRLIARTFITHLTMRSRTSFRMR